MGFLFRLAVGVWSLIAVIFGVGVLAVLLVGMVGAFSEPPHEAPRMSARVSRAIPVHAR